ncbi:uncharacterized protein LOC144146775 [Haemaphysalis longicornis]
MRLNAAATLFAAAYIWCVAAGPVPEASALFYGKPKCSRMFPWTEGEGVSGCTYLCRGWPIRRENEPDGVSCQGDGLRICLNGECVGIDEYIAPQSEAPLHNPYATEYVSVPTTSKSPTSTAAPPVYENTMTENHVHTTQLEGTTSHPPILQEDRSITSVDTLAEETGTSSSYKGARSSPSTVNTNPPKIKLIVTQDAGSEVASTTPSSVSSVHEGTTRVDHDGKQTYSATHQNDGFTNGSTTLSRRPISSSGTNAEELTSRPMHTDVHFGSVSDEVPGVKVSTKQAAPPAYETTVPATSTSKQSVSSSGIPHEDDTPTEIWNEDVSTIPTSPGTYVPTTISFSHKESTATFTERDNVSDLSGSRNTTPNNDFFTASTRKPSHSVSTRASQYKEHAVSEANQEDVSTRYPTLSDELLADFSTTNKQGLSRQHPTAPDQGFTSYAKSTNEETSSISANIATSSIKEMDAEAAMSGGTTKPMTMEPTFADPTFTTDQHYTYPDEEQSSAVMLDEIVSAHNQTPNFGLLTSTVSIQDRSPSTSVRAEWPSTTEKATFEEGSTNNNQATVTEDMAAVSSLSTTEYYTEGRSSGAAQTIATTSVEDASTHASTTWLRNATTLFASSSKQSKSTSAQMISSSTEMGGFSEPDSSSEQVTAAGTVSSAHASTASTKYPDSTTSPDIKIPSETQAKDDNPPGSTTPRLHLTIHHSRRGESKFTNEDTSSTSANIATSSIKEMDAEAAVSGGTSKPMTTEPTFAGPTFTTDQHDTYLDEEQSTAVKLDEIASGHNQTPNLGLRTSTVSIRDRSPSTSVRAEWPSTTEKATFEEGSTNNNHATVTQNMETVSSLSTTEYYTEGRSSGAAQTEDASTHASTTLLRKTTTLFASSSKQAKSTSAQMISSSTEMGGLSEPDSSSEQVTAAGRVSSAHASTASTKYPDSTTSPKIKISSETQAKDDNPLGSTTTSLHLTSHHSRSGESKSDSTPLRVNAVLSALCALFLIITTLI